MSNLIFLLTLSFVVSFLLNFFAFRTYTKAVNENYTLTVSILFISFISLFPILGVFATFVGTKYYKYGVKIG